MRLLITVAALTLAANAALAAADNRQVYVEEDLALLTGIADALRCLFARS